MYDDQFYSVIREGIRSSAAALVPRLLDLFPETKTVVDVGCGEGWWAKEFEDRGCTVLGIDGAYTQHAAVVPFQAFNLETERVDSVLHPFDMAVCLEVAEHLSPRRADTFIDDLCALSDVVVFSAAIPGQGGTGHINCQWQSWWAKKFEERGYWVSGELRLDIWEDDRIENWYRQNLLIAGSQGVIVPADLCGPPFVLDLVHPVLYDSVRPS